MRRPAACTALLACCAACIVQAVPFERRGRVLSDIAAMDARRAAEQAALKDVCSIADYAQFAKSVRGTTVWTDAFRAAVREHEVVRFPPGTYWMDGVVVLPSNRRIEATGATVKLLSPVNTVLLRNEHAQDGTLAPVDSAARDENIAVVGGRWEDWSERRAGYGRTGRFNAGLREKGTNFYGVSSLVYFGNVRGVTLQGVTFARVGAFAFQAGDVEDLLCDDIAFDGCFADGLHINGGCRNVHVRNVRGEVGDDLVALNLYDWQNSSVNFGPMDTVLCEDIAFTAGYPAFRMLPAIYTYRDGSTVDCALRNAVIRRVKGVSTYKMYLQTPPYIVGTAPERGAPGSGENIWFEDLDIDLDRPVDPFPEYLDGDSVRGHFAAFEIGANVKDVHLRNVRLKMHADRYPLSHLVSVGPKSILVPARKGKAKSEIFDPYVSCHVDEISIEGLEVTGELREAVHCTSFNDVNGDGRSSGAGKVGVVREMAHEE